MIYVNARFLSQRITGVQRFALEIARRLRKMDPDIRFLTTKHVVNQEAFDELGAQVIGRFGGHLWEQAELPVYVAYKGGMLVNLANTAPLYCSNQVVSICDLGFVRYPEFFSRAFSTFYNYLIPRIVKKSKGVITISEFSKREIVDLLQVAPQKITTVYCGVTDTLKDLSHKKPHHYGNFILAVSSIDPRKNFKRLLEAFIKLERSDVKLLICGDKNRIFRDASMAQAIQNNSSIIHLGYVTDQELAQLYQQALFFVYPSLYEGFGMPPLEAMANGCAVLASSIPSLQEVCGDAACYCDPLSVLDIAGKMKLMIEDVALRQNLIEKGIDRSLQFSWDDSAAKTYDWIRALQIGKS